LSGLCDRGGEKDRFDLFMTGGVILILAAALLIDPALALTAFGLLLIAIGVGGAWKQSRPKKPTDS
jgi:hypothetical protein